MTVICYFTLFCLMWICSIDCSRTKNYICNRTAECGCSKIDAELKKIIGGESALNSSWDWAVSLQTKNHRHLCGGTILSPKYIITAAHCVVNAFEIMENVRVVAGIDNLSQSTRLTTQIRRINKVILHEQYDDLILNNDIAILRVEQPLIISKEKHTAKICLPKLSSIKRSVNYPKLNSSLVAIGWGVLKFQGAITGNDWHLQQVTLNTLTTEHPMCESIIRNKQSQYCAGVEGGGKDTCQGDSGGPLMYFDTDTLQWILIGITSYGNGCGHPNYAGVYTRISFYHQWIDSIVNKTSNLSISFQFLLFILFFQYRL